MYILDALWGKRLTGYFLFAGFVFMGYRATRLCEGVIEFLDSGSGEFGKFRLTDYRFDVGVTLCDIMFLGLVFDVTAVIGEPDIHPCRQWHL